MPAVRGFTEQPRACEVPASRTGNLIPCSLCLAGHGRVVTVPVAVPTLLYGPGHVREYELLVGQEVGQFACEPPRVEVVAVLIQPTVSSVRPLGVGNDIPVLRRGAGAVLYLLEGNVVRFLPWTLTHGPYSAPLLAADSQQIPAGRTTIASAGASHGGVRVTCVSK